MVRPKKGRIKSLTARKEILGKVFFEQGLGRNGGTQRGGKEEAKEEGERNPAGGDTRTQKQGGGREGGGRRARVTAEDQGEEEKSVVYSRAPRARSRASFFCDTFFFPALSSAATSLGLGTAASSFSTRITSMWQGELM